MSRPSRKGGYTLIEILASFFSMTIILTLVTGISVENGRQRAAALGPLQAGLPATAALDPPRHGQRDDIAASQRSRHHGQNVGSAR